MSSKNIEDKERFGLDLITHEATMTKRTNRAQKNKHKQQNESSSLQDRVN